MGNDMGSVLNAPNDLAVHSNGGIDFTDPTLPTMPQFGGVTTELDFQGVYRISPSGTLELLYDEVPVPNAAALSPDETELYVTDTANEGAYAFALDGDGVPAGPPVQIYDGLPVADGMSVDANGNLYFTGPTLVSGVDDSRTRTSIIVQLTEQDLEPYGAPEAIPEITACLRDAWYQISVVFTTERPGGGE